MDDWRAYGPSSGTWIVAYDQNTGRKRRVLLCLPVLLPSYMVWEATSEEVKHLRDRTTKKFWFLTFMGFPTLLVTEDTLVQLGVRFHTATTAPVKSASKRRVTLPTPVQANGHCPVPVPLHN